MSMLRVIPVCVLATSHGGRSTRPEDINDILFEIDKQRFIATQLPTWTDYRILFIDDFQSKNSDNVALPSYSMCTMRMGRCLRNAEKCIRSIVIVVVVI